MSTKVPAQASTKSKTTPKGGDATVVKLPKKASATTGAASKAPASKAESRAPDPVRREAPPAGKAPADKPAPEASPAASGLQSYMVRDPEQMARNMVTMMEQGGRAIADYMGRNQAKSNPMAAAADMGDTSKTLGDVYQHWLADPTQFTQSQAELLQGYAELWNSTVMKTMGVDTKPVAQPAPGDNRFKDPEWSANPYFDFWKQAYLLTAQWSEKMLERSTGLDERTKAKAEFLFRQMAAAMAPTNFPLTNPEVMRETLASSGQNLVKGVENLAKDLGNSGSLLSISQVDTDAFEIGRNIAVTPGKVVFQNELIQIIQYTPTTKSVVAEPLLIVPPWINKFYILDLTQEKSFIKYAVDQGISVFVLSWVNPDERLAHKTFESYMFEGILSGTEAVARESGGHKPHVIGYCIGGTLLATTLAWLAAKGEEWYTTATFFAAQQDFSKPGDLKLFIDDEQLKKLDGIMAEKGYLEGSRMATVFNMLRPRDLIWPYIVNNYMLGKKPMAFDLLYWNQDSTRMSPANHGYYLREYYHENKLSKGTMTFADEKLDLGKVTLPIYALAAKEDHIAPAESVFIGAQLFGGPVRYVLGGSGHIAGVINPPYKIKYQYWTSDSMAKTYQGWLKGAKETPGSWWPDWVRWLKDHSSGEVPARKPGARLGVIEDAPGSYVKVKS